MLTELTELESVMQPKATSEELKQLTLAECKHWEMSLFMQ